MDLSDPNSDASTLDSHSSILPELNYTFIADDVGRGRLLAECRETLLSSDVQRFALVGEPGIGKTYLALCLAYDNAIKERFSDGILWAGLSSSARHRSYSITTKEHIADVNQIFWNWAIELGIDPKTLKADIDEQDLRTHIEGILAQKQVLIILDDVVNRDQIQPLLFVDKTTGRPNINLTYLITTRNQEVAAKDFDDRITDNFREVHELTLNEGVQLFGTHYRAFAHSFPKETETLVNILGFHPLAIVLIGDSLSKDGRLIAPPIDLVDKIIEEIADIEHRFQIEGKPLGREDQNSSLEVAFAWSYDRLNEIDQGAFSTLFVFPPKHNSFSRQAGNRVASQPDDWDGLTQLKTYSLLENYESERTKRTREPRFMLPRVIADYSEYRWRQGKQNADVIYTRMIDYYVDYAEKNAWDIEALNQDRGNIHRAFDKIIETIFTLRLNSIELTAMIEKATRLLESLTDYWITVSSADVGLKYALDILENLPASTDPCLRIRVLIRSGRLEISLDKIPNADLHLSEALALLHQHNNCEYYAVELLPTLAQLRRKQGRSDEQKQLLEEALDLLALAEVQKTLPHWVVEERRLTIKLSLSAYYTNKHPEVTEENNADFETARKLLYEIILEINPHYDEEANETLYISRYIEHYCGALYNLAEIAIKSSNDRLAHQYLDAGIQQAKRIGYKRWLTLAMTRLAVLTVNYRLLGFAEIQDKEPTDVSDKMFLQAFREHLKMLTSRKDIDVLETAYTSALFLLIDYAERCEQWALEEAEKIAADARYYLKLNKLSTARVECHLAYVVAEWDPKKAKKILTAAYQNTTEHNKTHVEEIEYARSYINGRVREKKAVVTKLRKLPVQIFISHAHHPDDDKILNELLPLISGSFTSKECEIFIDTAMRVGDPLHENIANALERVEIFIAMVSQIYLTRPYVKKEIKKAIIRRKKEGIIIFPIILSACEWERENWLQSTLFAPGDGKNIEQHYTDSGERKALFKKILGDLRTQMERVREKRGNELCL